MGKMVRTDVEETAISRNVLGEGVLRGGAEKGDLGIELAGRGGREDRGGEEGQGGADGGELHVGGWC